MEGVGHEALGGQLGPAQVAARQPGAAHEELALDPDGQRPQALVEHVHARVADRFPDRHGGRARVQLARDAVGGREGGALGGAVAVDELRARQGRERAAHVRHRERLAPRQELLQARQAARVLVHDGVEQRGGEPERGHAVPPDGRPEPGRGGHRFIVHDHQAAVEQRAPDLEGRGVEGQRGRVEDALLGPQPHVVHGQHQAVDGPVRDLDAFGQTRGPRRVGHVGEAFGPRAALDRGCRLVRQARALAVQRQGPPRERRHQRLEGRVCQEHPRARVGEDEGQALPRVAGFERQVGAPGLEHGQQGHDGVGRALEQQGHGLIRGNAQRAQARGQPARLAVQLSVAEAALGRGHRRRVRLASDHLREQLRHAGVVAVVHRRAVPDVEQELPLGRWQQRDLAQEGVGPGGQGQERHPEVIGQARDGPVVEARAIEADLQLAQPRVHAQDQREALRCGGPLGGLPDPQQALERRARGGLGPLRQRAQPLPRGSLQVDPHAHGPQLAPRRQLPEHDFGLARVARQQQRPGGRGQGGGSRAARLRRAPPGKVTDRLSELRLGCNRPARPTVHPEPGRGDIPH